MRRVVVFGLFLVGVASGCAHPVSIGLVTGGVVDGRQSDSIVGRAVGGRTHELLASVDTAGVVRVWDKHRGRLAAAVHSGEVRWKYYSAGGPPMVFSPDGVLLALGKSDGTIELWAARGGRLVRTLHAPKTRMLEYKPGVPPLSPNDDPTVGLAFNEDGSLLASAASTGTGTLWNVADGASIAVLPCGCPSDFDAPRVALAFDSDSRAIAAYVANRQVGVYAVPSGFPVTGFQMPRIPAAAAFDPTGDALIIADRAGWLYVWSLSTRQPFWSRMPTTEEEQRHTGAAVAFSRDGSRVATLGPTGTLTIRESRTGVQLADWHTSLSAGQMWFNSDDRRIVAIDLTTGDTVSYGAPYGRTIAAQIQARLEAEPPPTTTVVGTVTDRETSRAIAGVAVGILTASPSHARLTDSAGLFVIDSVPGGLEHLVIGCGNEVGWGIRLVDTTLRVDVANPVLLRMHADEWRCHSPAPTQRKLTLRGYYTAGFETSDFTPCADTGAATRAIWSRPVAPDMWVAGVSHAPVPKRWPPPDTTTVPGEARWYVEWRGTVLGPGHFGHLLGAAYEVDVTSVQVVRTHAPVSCRASH